MKRMLAVTLTAAVAVGARLDVRRGAQSPQGTAQPAAGAPQRGQQPPPAAPGGWPAAADAAARLSRRSRSRIAPASRASSTARA